MKKYCFFFFFYLKLFIFLVVKFSVYLNRRVYVMKREPSFNLRTEALDILLQGPNANLSCNDAHLFTFANLLFSQSFNDVHFISLSVRLFKLIIKCRYM